MLRGGVIAGVLALLAVPAATAGADDPPMHPGTRRALDVALDKWGDGLCGGRVTVVWQELAQRDRDGWADVDTCLDLDADDDAPARPVTWLDPDWAAWTRDRGSGTAR